MTTLLPVATATEVRRATRDQMRGHWLMLLAALAVLLGGSAVGLAGPVAIGWIAQAVASRQGTDALVGPVALLVGGAVAAALTIWAGQVLLARVVLPVVGRLREQALAAAVGLPIDIVEAGGTGDLVSRVSGDAEQAAEVAQEALAEFLTAVLTILVTLAGLATLDWRFALAGLLAVPVQLNTLRWYLRTSRPIYAAGRAADGRRASALLIGFTALPTLRALGLGRRQRDRIADASADAMEYEFQSIRTATRFYGRLNAAEFIGLGAILLVAFFLVRADVASIGAATTAALFFAGLFGPVNTALGVFDDLQQATAGLARLVGITQTAAATPPQTAALSDGRRGSVGELQVDGVRFGYGDGPDVLHDVTLSVPPGGRVAIVGASGSGKSSLASLLAGLRSPRAGRITLGGEPLEGPGRAVALVTQETHIFAGTVADNVRLATPEATRDEVAAALAESGADWVSALPDGLDCEVGSGGRSLTANEAQHLALARVLLLDPQVVVLDEATAESGSDAARVLDRASAAVLRGRSGVVVAHRLSQAVNADAILVMDAGRIVERGTHAELLAARGAYAALWSAWSASSIDS